jgi:hypothetical protein
MITSPLMTTTASPKFVPGSSVREREREREREVHREAGRRGGGRKKERKRKLFLLSAPRLPASL